MSVVRLNGAVVLVLGILAGSVQADPPKVNFLFPTGVQRGQSAVVTANGSWSQWPVTAWIDRPGMTVTCEEAKGSLRVTVDPQAGSGIYWVRLYDATGATELRPLVVDSPAGLVEKEPNETIRQATPVSVPAAAYGQLAKRGDVDTYALPLQRGQTLVASVLANRLGAPMDPVLQVVSSQGFVLAQQDDECGMDPQLAFVAPRNDTYLIRLFAFPETPDSSIGFAGNENFVYRLTLTTSEFIDGAIPLVVPREGSVEVRPFGWNLPADLAIGSPQGGPSDELRWLYHPQAAGWLALPVSAEASFAELEDSTAEKPLAIDRIPATISGRLAAAKDEDVFEFRGTKGQKLNFRVESRSLGYPTDSRLQLTDAQGKVLADADDAGQIPDAVLTPTLPADGTYRLLVRDVFGHGGVRYFYRIRASVAAPDFSLKLAANTFATAPGKALEIPVTIERQEGFAGDIVVRLIGLPDGVTCEPVTSAGSGDTAKAVKLIVNAAQGPVSSNFRVEGTAQVGDASQTRFAIFPAKDPAAEHRDLWITILANP